MHRKVSVLYGKKNLGVIDQSNTVQYCTVVKNPAVHSIGTGTMAGSTQYVVLYWCDDVDPVSNSTVDQYCTVRY